MGEVDRTQEANRWNRDGDERVRRTRVVLIYIFIVGSVRDEIEVVTETVLRRSLKTRTTRREICGASFRNRLRPTPGRFLTTRRFPKVFAPSLIFGIVRHVLTQVQKGRYNTAVLYEKGMPRKRSIRRYYRFKKLPCTKKIVGNARFKFRLGGDDRCVSSLWARPTGRFDSRRGGTLARPSPSSAVCPECR